MSKKLKLFKEPEINYTMFEREGRASIPVAVILRKKGAQETDTCPFCGDTHIHGSAPGHRVVHCVDIKNKSITLRNGLVLEQDHGYVIKEYTGPAKISKLPEVAPELKVNSILFIYAKDGKIKVLSSEHEKEHEKIRNDGWKHSATLNAGYFLEQLFNYIPDNQLRKTIQSLAKG